MSSNNLYPESKKRRSRILDFTWVLFLGVLPFDKASLTLYSSDTLGSIISIILNGLTLVGAVVGWMSIRSKNKKKLSKKYILFFIALSIIYLCAGFVDQISISRFFSLICLLGYCLFAICHYDDYDKLLRDINKATFFIIVLSFVLYIAGDKNVLYIENAYSIVFKGVASNRNSYSEISLFYIATNIYIWRQDKKFVWWRFITTIFAAYTTFLTNGATSIICGCLLLVLLAGCKWKLFRKLYSFNLFLVIYGVIFGIVVLSQSVELDIIKELSTLFGKAKPLTGRTDIWLTAIECISEAPMFGFGYDTQVLFDLGIHENDPHNGLLYIALTQGIAGVVTFVGMLLFIIKNSGRSILKKDNAYISMLVFVIVWLIKGLVESVFSYTHFVFWCALIVMELSMYKLSEKEMIKENNDE